MELEAQKIGEVTKSHDFEASNFTIKANAHSFKILSSGMYSNKIRAIVRELSTNAYDSHVQAGNEHTPFDIYFPNQYAPFFKIRDYGVSIAHEDMQEVYCSFFGSTKTHTNTLNGAFGLGSKAFFCYVHSANISTFINGVQRMYVAMLGEEGLPTLNFLGECETDEANGLEIQLPVSRSDYGLFQDEVRILKHFPTRPTVHGVHMFNWEVYDNEHQEYKGDNWCISKSHRSNHSVIMGYIAYPIDLNNLRSQLDRWGYSDNLEITLPIGAFSITPSREQISYDAKTVEVLEKAINKAMDELTAIIAKKVEEQESYFEACLLLCSEKIEYVRHSLRKLSWRGKALEEVFYLRKEQESVHRFSSSRTNTSFRVSKDSKSIDSLRIIDVKDKLLFVYADEEKSATILRNYLRQESLKTGASKSAYLITPPEKYRRTSTFEATGFPLDKIVLASDLADKIEVIEKVKSTSTPRPKAEPGVQVCQFVPRWYDAPVSNYWLDAHTIDMDTSKGGYWLPINRWSLHEVDFSLETLSTTSTQVSGLTGKDVPVVYGVRKKDHKKFETDPKWIRFDHYLKEAMQNFLSADGMLACAHFLIKEAIEQHTHADARQFLKVTEHTNLGGELGELVGRVQALDLDLSDKTQELGRTVHSLMTSQGDDSFRRDLEKDLNLNKLRPIRKALIKRYPLLRSIIGYSLSMDNSTLKHMIEYIQLKETV